MKEIEKILTQSKKYFLIKNSVKEKQEFILNNLIFDLSFFYLNVNKILIEKDKKKLSKHIYIYLWNKYFLDDKNNIKENESIKDFNLNIIEYFLVLSDDKNLVLNFDFKKNNLLLEKTEKELIKFLKIYGK